MILIFKIFISFEQSLKYWCIDNIAATNLLLVFVSYTIAKLFYPNAFLGSHIFPIIKYIATTILI